MNKPDFMRRGGQKDEVRKARRPDLRPFLLKLKGIQCLAGAGMLAGGILSMYVMVMAGSIEKYIMFSNYILIVAGVAVVHYFAADDQAGTWSNREILHTSVLFVTFVIQQISIVLCIALVIYSTLSEQSMSKIGFAELLPASLAAAVSIFHYNKKRRAEKAALAEGKNS